jgi:hypothetical protein
MFPSKFNRFYCKNLMAVKFNLVFLSVYDAILFYLRNIVMLTSYVLQVHHIHDSFISAITGKGKDMK